MLSGPLAVKSVALLGLSSVLLGLGISHRARVYRSSTSQRSAEDLLQAADELAWNNRWADARPLYAQAQNDFTESNQRSRALYARVSQEPPNESESVRTKILRLRQDLQEEPARDPETRLRVLTVIGMFETNYDASQASTTWGEVRSLALSRGHFELASRAEGEQGIAAFLLGDTNTAKREVVAAWSLANAERDYAATVRYASVFGAGLVELGRYKEALSPLEQAIELTKKHPQIAYPTIAIYTKVDALSGLGRYSEALALANDSVDRLRGTTYAGHQLRYT